MNEHRQNPLVTLPALVIFLFCGSAFAQAAPPPPSASRQSEPETAVAPAPSATSEPAGTSGSAVVPRPTVAPVQPAVAPVQPAVAPASDDVSGPPSDLPYYLPQGAERLPEIAVPVAPPQPEAPGLKVGFGPLFRVHVPTSSLNLTYAEIGGVVRLGSAGIGLSVSGTTWGSIAGGFELPTLKGIPIYEGPVTVAFVQRGHVQLQGHPGFDLLGYSAGLTPSFQVAGCQGIPWYFNAGAHLTGHIFLLLDGGGNDPVISGTIGPAFETGILFF